MAYNVLMTNKRNFQCETKAVYEITDPPKAMWAVANGEFDEDTEVVMATLLSTQIFGGLVEGRQMRDLLVGGFGGMTEHEVRCFVATLE